MNAVNGVPVNLAANNAAQSTVTNDNTDATKLFAQLLAQQMDSSLLSLADFSSQDGEDGGNSDQLSYLSMLSIMAQMMGSGSGQGSTGALPANMAYGMGAMNMNSSAAGMVGSGAAQAALTRVGDPYSQGKRGTGDYVDCSYLTQWAYSKTGVSLPGTAATQAQYCAQNGYTIPQQDLQQGDLVFWEKAGCECGRYDEIHHVGIYLGDGKVVEASSSKGQVVVNDLWDGGKWQIAMCARPY